MAMEERKKKRKTSGHDSTSFKIYVNKSLCDWVSFVLAIVATVFQIRTPKILGRATTEIFEGLKKGFMRMKAGQQNRQVSD